MTRRLVPVLVLLAGCAHAPRPVPPDAKPADRLLQAEDTLLTANGLTATFELDAKGEAAAHFTGTLELGSGNALHLVAEGAFKGEAAHVELDSRDAEGTNRTTTRGPSVSSHRDPPAAHLREALALALVRRGLLHDVVKLTEDQALERAEGGAQGWLQAVAPRDGGREAIAGEPCRRVDFELHVEGTKRGEASLCLSDQTGLPLQRTLAVRSPTGELTVTESYTWRVK